jgi:hypothetical protein
MLAIVPVCKDHVTPWGFGTTVFPESRTTSPSCSVPLSRLRRAVSIRRRQRAGRRDFDRLVHERDDRDDRVLERPDGADDAGLPLVDRLESIQTHERDAGVLTRPVDRRRADKVAARVRQRQNRDDRRPDPV